MAKFTQQQLRQSLDFLHEIYAWRDQEGFAQQLPASLLTLIQANVCSYKEYNGKNKNGILTYAPLCAPTLPNIPEILENANQGEEGEKFLEMDRMGFTTLRTTGDVWTSSEWQRTIGYNELHRPLRIPHVLASTIKFTGFSNEFIQVGIYRNGHNFTEEERDLLELVRLHLVQAHGNAKRVSHMQHHLSRINGAVEALPQGVVVLSSKGWIEWMTVVAKNYLKRFWPDWKQRKDSLPTLLGNWITSQLQLFDDPDYAPGIQMTLTLNKGNHRLMIRLVPQGNQHVLFLEKEPIDLPLNRLDPYDLTPREKDVLGWAIQGKSNPEISQILGTSPLTIQKQFGSIYQKLGVENRSAAVATALEIMRLAN